MRGLLLIWLLLCSGISMTSAQTATDLNEGLQLATGTTPGDFTLTWWGKTGRTYFVQQSSDLLSWHYLPMAETGVAAVTGMNFSTSDSRQFWRLVYTDAPVPTGLTAWTADFDGDGISNHDEVFATVATNPFLQDTDWDGFTDSEEITAGTNPTGGDSTPAAPAPTGPLNPDSSYRNGIRLDYSEKGMVAAYSGVTSSGYGSAGHFGNGPPNHFFPFVIRTTDFVEEVSTAYSGTPFQAPGLHQYFTSGYSYSLEYWNEVTKSTGPPATTSTIFRRNSFLVKATLSPGAPADAVRTVVAFYFEGPNTNLANLKRTGTITFGKENAVASDSIARHCQGTSNPLVIEPNPPSDTPAGSNPSYTITTKRGHLELEEVAITPEAGMVGVLGDVIKSAKAGKDGKMISRVRHFVTPKAQTDYLPQPYVEFTVPDMTTSRFNTLYEWDTADGEGGEEGSQVYKRKVKRDATGLTKLRILTKKDRTVVDEMYVWVVWCDAPTLMNGGITKGTAVFNVLTKPNLVIGPDGQPIEFPPIPIGKRWEIKSDYWKFKFVIQPKEICDQDERPDLEGPKKTFVPGVGKPHTTGPNGDGDHAAKKWDVSRQMKITIRNPGSIPKASLELSGPNWFGNQPVAADTPVEFPTNPAEGNDDPFSPDEDDNPYQASSSANLEHQVGELSSLDDPRFPVLNSWGVAGRHYGCEANFREFCRLEINDGNRTNGTSWFRISDYSLWHHYLSTDYDGGGNEWNDAGSSTDTGHAIP